MSFLRNEELKVLNYVSGKETSSLKRIKYSILTHSDAKGRIQCDMVILWSFCCKMDETQSLTVLNPNSLYCAVPSLTHVSG